MLFDPKTGVPQFALRILARRHGIENPKALLADQLAKRVEGVWMRAVSHQFQICGQPPGADDSALLNELELIASIDAPPGEYHHALLLGSSVPAVRKRLSHLIRQYTHGARFQKVALLGSCRSLDSEKESAEVLCAPWCELSFKPDWTPPATMPTTEAEMMQFIFDQSELPSAWQSCLIQAPDQPKDAGGLRPANTEDTLRAALANGLEPGRYILVSGQPYVRRQTLNARRVLGDQFDITPTGYCAPTATMPLPAFLDEVQCLLNAELLTVLKNGKYPWSS